ncbi:MAG: hypothetical protein LBD21_01520 [Tannerellaceae bacterium]|nr:hypothetical protein [Tannerellaceae bacterium]
MSKRISNGMIAFMLAAALALMTFSCLKTEGYPDDEHEPTIDYPELEVAVGRMQRDDAGRLLAIAATRSFDTRTDLDTIEIQDWASVLRAEGDRPYVSYPYDAIQISGALFYTVGGDRFPFLRQICGQGDLLVTVSAFTAYVEQHDRPENLEPPLNTPPGMRIVVSDGMIAFRGPAGVYSCLLNDGANYTAIFSSHKKLTEHEEIKDFTPPLYYFYLNAEVGRTRLGFQALFGEDGMLHPDTNIVWAELVPQGTYTEPQLYDVDELTKFPQSSQVCTLTGMTDSMMFVTAPAPSEIRNVLFDAYTVFTEKGLPATADAFKPGDVITITYDEPYEGYRPWIVFANTVSK